MIFITRSYICSNMLTLTCSLHTGVSFMQNSSCKYFLQITIIMCVCIDMHSMQSAYLARRIYEITCKKLINSTRIVYAHSRLDFVFRGVPFMVERLSLIFSTEVSMLITYFNMELEIVNKLCCSINMLLSLIVKT